MSVSDFDVSRPRLIRDGSFLENDWREIAQRRRAHNRLGCQRLAILEYARKHDFHIDDFIEATASGRASETRRRLDELMTVLQPATSWSSPSCPGSADLWVRSSPSSMPSRRSPSPSSRSRRTSVSRANRTSRRRS